MAGHQLTDMNVLDESFIIPKETCAVFCILGQKTISSKLYPSAAVEYGPQTVSTLTLDLMFYNSRLSPMDLKVPTARKINFLNSHPRVIRKISTVCKHCSAHLLTNGYSRRRADENGSLLSTERLEVS